MHHRLNREHYVYLQTHDSQYVQLTNTLVKNSKMVKICQTNSNVPEHTWHLLNQYLMKFVNIVFRIGHTDHGAVNVLKEKTQGT